MFKTRVHENNHILQKHAYKIHKPALSLIKLHRKVKGRKNTLDIICFLFNSIIKNDYKSKVATFYPNFVA